jgi:hypothetical protein
MNVKDMSRIADRFIRKAAAAGPDYDAGVSNPRVDWEQATKAAEANYEQGVQAGIAKKRFGKGVAKAGTSKFLRGAKEKGVARFAAGVAASAGDYAAGFEPYRSALASTTLQPRKARRDPSNLTRVNQVVQAMIRTAESQGK